MISIFSTITIDILNTMKRAPNGPCYICDFIIARKDVAMGFKIP